ncbi:Peptidase, partial [Oryctes borbonicus]
MPVLSPHRGSTPLTSPYRSSLGSSALDRSYYSSAGSYPRYSYSERYTATSYRDSDGRKTYTRSGSITEDGITTRFREESREGSLRRDSLSRDSGISSIRENSILETSAVKRERDNSLTRSSGADRDRFSQLSVIESVADFRNKYSPANYVPAVYRKKENISRSKSINDIGLPPIEKSTNATNAKKKVKDYNNSLGLTELSNTTTTNNDNMYIIEDDNGNRQPVSEIRKRFENNSPRTSSINSISSWKERSKKEENNDISKEIKRPLKLSKLENDERIDFNASKMVLDDNNSVNTTSDLEIKKMNGDVEFSNKKFGGCDITDKQNDNQCGKFDNATDDILGKHVSSNANLLNGLEVAQRSKSTVTDRQDRIKNGIELRRSAELTDFEEDNSASASADLSSSSANNKLNGGESRRNTSNRVNNFSSYIPTKDYEKGDIVNGIGTTTNTLVDNRLETDPINNENNRNDMSNLNKSRLYQDKTNNDLTTSPRLNRTSLIQNASSSLPSNNSASTSNNIGGRSSLNRDDDSRNSYDRPSNRITSSPVRHQGLNGLKNIGNTCFMNSVIQCLSNTKPLLEYVRRDAYLSDINTSISSMKGALIKAFSQVIKELWSEDSSDRVVNTVSLKSQIQRFAPRFMGYAQQDAQEFLRYLLEGLHEDVNRVTTKPTPIHTEIDEKLSDAEKASESWQRYLRMDNSKIVDIFVGQLKSTLKCTHCGHCSVTFDPFWDLSLPIPQKVGQIRLQQCLDSFTREETLDGDEKPTCSKCKERRKCTKSFSIQKFPKILVIHLKRFSPTERFRGKLSVTVDFPLEGLDMSNYSAD